MPLPSIFEAPQFWGILLILVLWVVVMSALASGGRADRILLNLFHAWKRRKRHLKPKNNKQR